MSIVQRAGMLAAGLSLVACGGTTTPPVVADPRPMTPMQQKLSRYTPVRLTADIAALTAGERRMIPLLIDAARAMDDVFWLQAYGDREALLRSIIDPDARRLVEINYGPWDRLDDDRPFIPDVGEKPKGANFYPRDMTDEEFQAAVAESPERAAAFKSLYTLVRREPGGKLVAVPYHEAYSEQVHRAVAALRAAAPLAEQASLRRYLELRANALESDDYQPSDLAWMDMKDNTVDFVVGPIETYEDQRYGYKAAHEAFVLIKDRAWSARLARYATFLPALQEGLPVAAELKREKPGTDSDLNAYDAVYYAGQANAGAKSIAINLPNDEEVQLKKGARRLQLKNAMQAKFDKILLPIARELIVEDELARVKFDAFFENVMFHEVAHGLGIKNTITGHGTVRTALKEKASALEEGKADVLGLYMVTALNARGELGREDVRDNFVTFLASLFRSVRFGGADAHGRANIAQFNFLHRRGAFTREGRTGRYRVNFDKMKPALDELSSRILTLQGKGDYDGVVAFEAEFGKISPELQRDLDRLAASGIPVDIVFEQGK